MTRASARARAWSWALMSRQAFLHRAHPFDRLPRLLASPRLLLLRPRASVCLHASPRPTALTASPRPPPRPLPRPSPHRSPRPRGLPRAKRSSCPPQYSPRLVRLSRLVCLRCPTALRRAGTQPASPVHRVAWASARPWARARPPAPHPLEPASYLCHICPLCPARPAGPARSDAPWASACARTPARPPARLAVRAFGPGGRAARRASRRPAAARARVAARRPSWARDLKAALPLAALPLLPAFKLHPRPSPTASSSRRRRRAAPAAALGAAAAAARPRTEPQPQRALLPPIVGSQMRYVNRHRVVA